MLDIFKKMLGGNVEEKDDTKDIQELILSGATVIDVRGKDEYASGHAKNAINVPLDTFGSIASVLPDKQAVIITCCASGGRSSMAKRMLEDQGYTNIHNGGSWRALP